MCLNKSTIDYVDDSLVCSWSCLVKRRLAPITLRPSSLAGTTWRRKVRRKPEKLLRLEQWTDALCSWFGKAYSEYVFLCAHSSEWEREKVCVCVCACVCACVCIVPVEKIICNSLTHAFMHRVSVSTCRVQNQQCLESCVHEAKTCRYSK